MPRWPSVQWKRWTESATMVDEATTAAEEISIATQQQRSASDQVVVAMTQVSEASRQYAAGSRQTESASTEIAALAAAMQDSISTFNVWKRLLKFPTGVRGRGGRGRFRRRTKVSRRTSAFPRPGLGSHPWNTDSRQPPFMPGKTPDQATGAVVPAIHQVSTFKQDGVGGLRGGYEYSRSANPTRTALEECLAAIEQGTCVDSPSPPG